MKEVRNKVCGNNGRCPMQGRVASDWIRDYVALSSSKGLTEILDETSQKVVADGYHFYMRVTAVERKF